MTPARRRLPLLAVLFATVVSFVLSSRLRLSSDLLSMLPDDKETRGFAEFARAFGGGDAAVVLVTGEAPEAVALARSEAGARLREESTLVDSVIERLDPPALGRASDVFRYAGPATRRKLASALNDAGMRERLAVTRAMLLAPGGGSAAEERLAIDPLRLAMIPFEGPEVTANVPLGDLTTDDKKAGLLLCKPKVAAFDHAGATRFVTRTKSILADVARRHPGVSLGLAGGHATAVATEASMKEDLVRSSALSLVLAAIAFVITFRRARALVAVLPPLACGTAWTVAIASLVASPLSAISLAFVSVVVGVGVDSGTHVYAALLEGRSRGLSPREAADHARKSAVRPVMVAALAAGATFATLSFAGLQSLRELGLLAGAGEILTAVAIVVVTPEIGAWLESGPLDPAQPTRVLSWPTGFFDRLTTATGRTIVLGLAFVTVIATAVFAAPRTSETLVLLRPKSIEPLQVQERVFQLFGGKTAISQWIILVRDREGERAKERADAIFEALDELRDAGDVAGFDSLSVWSPSPRAVQERIEATRSIDFPRAAAQLTRALDDAGFDADSTSAAASSLREGVRSGPALELPSSLSGWLDGRYVARDGNGDTLVATFVRPTGDPTRDRRAKEVLGAADPRAVITGAAAVERSLHRSLGSGLPRVLVASILVVTATLLAGLRRTRALVAALVALVFEAALVLLAMRVANVSFHVYDALIVPVLLGITLDEVLFVEHATRRGGEGDQSGVDSLAREAPLVTSTALTSAMGFAALFVCRFDGLRDLAFVGAVGSIAGLVSAIVVVPCVLGPFVRPAR